MFNYKLTYPELFKNYLLWLDPLLQLTAPEREILAAYMTMHYKYRDDKEMLDILFSSETKEIIRKKIKLTLKVFNDSYSKLFNKGYITDNGLSNKLTNYPKEWLISVKFDII